MVEIFIQEKNQSNLLTLKVITNKDKLHTLIEKKEWKSTLISEENNCYLFIDKENNSYNFHSIYEYFVNFSSSSEKSWNIDIKSFVAKGLSEEEVIQAISEGILFGSHRQITYKQQEEIKKSDKSYYLITKSKKLQEILDNSTQKLEAVNWARDLQDTPPNKLHAKEFSEQVKERFDKLKDVEIEILDKKQIEKNKMGLVLSVNAGSHHEPRVVILRYFGDKKNKDNIFGLVGKGITFDSGGYNLKSSAALNTMKFDMSGAAVVCSSFLALTKTKPKINVVAIACLTDNVISGHATLTESVITSMSGKTVEINNTDAEGRLVLADGITYAIQKEKVNKIITVATLTGAVVSALGESLTGIMTNNREFYRKLRKSFDKSKERYWELPIIPENTKFLKENTSIANISNISSSRYMGASNGAAFLQEFVEKLPFIHCDIAGTAVKSKSKRGNGSMVKTLIELFNNYGGK